MSSPQQRDNGGAGAVHVPTRVVDDISTYIQKVWLPNEVPAPNSNPVSLIDTDVVGAVENTTLAKRMRAFEFLVVLLMKGIQHFYGKNIDTSALSVERVDVVRRYFEASGWTFDIDFDSENEVPKSDEQLINPYVAKHRDALPFVVHIGQSPTRLNVLMRPWRSSA